MVDLIYKNPSSLRSGFLLRLERLRRQLYRFIPRPSGRGFTLSCNKLHDCVFAYLYLLSLDVVCPEWIRAGLCDFQLSKFAGLNWYNGLMSRENSPRISPNDIWSAQEERDLRDINFAEGNRTSPELQTGRGLFARMRDDAPQIYEVATTFSRHFGVESPGYFKLGVAIAWEIVRKSLVRNDQELYLYEHLTELMLAEWNDHSREGVISFGWAYEMVEEHEANVSDWLQKLMMAGGGFGDIDERENKLSFTSGFLVAIIPFLKQDESETLAKRYFGKGGLWTKLKKMVRG